MSTNLTCNRRSARRAAAKTWAMGVSYGVGSLLFASSNVSAQVNLPRAAGVGMVSPMPMPVPRQYIVGPEDVLNITVRKHPEFSVSQAVVPQNGLIAVPVIGTLRVDGKSLEQLDAEVTRRLRVRLRNPDVSITVDKPRSRPIYVVGQVKTPGPYEAKPNWRVTQVLAAAGGLAVDSETAAVVVNRNNRNLVDTLLAPLLLDPGQPQNILLQSGDTVRIYERKATVTVTGAVARPGTYSVPRNSGIAEAISLAGGPKPSAALARAVLRRADGTEQPLDLYQLLVRGVQSYNIVLRSDDSIAIPELRGITVIGEVTTPGSYPLDDGRNPHLSDAIAAAGGLKIKPEMARISVARAGANGQFVAQGVNAVGLLEQSDPTQNKALQDGDIVSVAAIKTNTVFISGEVRTPGAYELQEGDGLAEVISRAGGPTPDASLAQVAVTRRDGSKTVVDTSAALLQGADRAGEKLHDGDVVVVPRSKNRVLVVGAVGKPGSYAMPEDRTLTVGDAISLAGGTQNNAKKVTLMHPKGNQVESTLLRLDRAEKGVLGVNRVMEAGDVLYVPEGKPRQSTLDTIASFLPGVTWLLR